MKNWGFNKKIIILIILYYFLPFFIKSQTTEETIDLNFFNKLNSISLTLPEQSLDYDINGNILMNLKLLNQKGNNYYYEKIGKNDKKIISIDLEKMENLKELKEINDLLPKPIKNEIKKEENKKIKYTDKENFIMDIGGLCLLGGMISGGYIGNNLWQGKDMIKVFSIVFGAFAGMYISFGVWYLGVILMENTGLLDTKISSKFFSDETEKK